MAAVMDLTVRARARSEPVHDFPSQGVSVPIEGGHGREGELGDEEDEEMQAFFGSW